MLRWLPQQENNTQLSELQHQNNAMMRELLTNARIYYIGSGILDREPSPISIPPQQAGAYNTEYERHTILTQNLETVKRKAQDVIYDLAAQYPYYQKILQKAGSDEDLPEVHLKIIESIDNDPNTSQIIKINIRELQNATFELNVVMETNKYDSEYKIRLQKIMDKLEKLITEEKNKQTKTQLPMTTEPMPLNLTSTNSNHVTKPQIETLEQLFDNAKNIKTPVTIDTNNTNSAKPCTGFKFKNNKHTIAIVPIPPNKYTTTPNQAYYKLQNSYYRPFQRVQDPNNSIVRMESKEDTKWRVELCKQIECNDVNDYLNKFMVWWQVRQAVGLDTTGVPEKLVEFALNNKWNGQQFEQDTPQLYKLSDLCDAEQATTDLNTWLKDKKAYYDEQSYNEMMRKIE